MRLSSICSIAFLATLVQIQPLCAELNEARPGYETTLCPFVRIAATKTELEAEAAMRMREAEMLFATDTGLFSSATWTEGFVEDPAKFPADRKLFESSLVDWLFFEDLAAPQRALLAGLVARCGPRESRTAVHASVFAQLDSSQRATFVSVTHAMLNTVLIDRQDGSEIGNTLALVSELVDIHGENGAQPSDHQFQLIVQLVPGALQKLQRAAGLDIGENRVFHKDYPLSFRQLRNIGVRGEQAGLHICATRDGRLAEVHIDYRFGLLHLAPANSDVRADGNHQRHVDRWPQVRFAARSVRVRRPILR